MLDVGCSRPSRHSPPVTLAAPKQSEGGRHSQRGVALIITLILLSVVTFMAITFLALSRRERSAVSTVTDTASARLAADAALANAEGQIMANALSTTNPYNFGLLVSTNYINVNGFDPANVNPFENVNYNHLLNNSTPLSQIQFLTLLTNLWYSPRPPVFIPNPTNSSLPADFRYYLDLNRNGRYDTNGFVLETNFLGQAGINFEVGDPEWIGVLQRPDQPYGPNNPFVARFAFIAVPVGNTLDLNAIYNQAMTGTVNPAANGSDGFFRNQGVGSWEINLAAFLTDLDPNQWDNSLLRYNYYEPVSPNSGYAFEDALSLLSYRYGYNYNSLTNAAALLNGALGLANGNIDGYSDWSLMTTPAVINVINQKISGPGAGWAGADNTNHFFTPEELFNTNEILAPFVNRLLAAGTTNSIYENYTFYRLLSQLGTDSTPDSGKMNLNYDNLVLTNANGVASETNFYSWTAINFFTNAADRLLRAYTTQWRNSNPTNFAATFYTVTNFNFINSDQWTNYPAFGIGNIPVWVSNQFVYSPAVNRLLQLAANIYDATTNNTYAPGNNYPSVFRPLFLRDVSIFGTNVFISGYTNVAPVTGTSDDQLAFPIDAADLAVTNIVFTNLAVNVYGVPWIIGAKKGFPNFNELAMESAFQLTRKLQVTRANTNASINTYSYNQMYLLNLTNQLGVECWNSYTGNYTNPVMIYATEYLKSIILTNDEGFSTNLSFITTGVLPINNWPGYNPYLPNPSFQIPLNTSIMAITNSMYRFNSGSPYLTTNLALPYEINVKINGSIYPQPHWWLMLTNNLRVIMLDTTVTPNRVIDYVQLRGPNSFRDLTAEIQASFDTGTGINDLWDTTTNQQGMPTSLANQIGVSLGNNTSGSGWDTTDLTQREKEIDGFRVFYHLSPIFFPNGNYGIDASTNIHQVPYTPTANAVQHISWQANDPLVHYISGDLNWSGASHVDSTIDALTDENLGVLNQRYMPWGGNPLTLGADQYPCYPAIKDPLVRQSDDWDFPTNKFPGVGWLGRVHRGTPWQTVYLKASDVLNLVQIIGTPPTATTNYIGMNTWMTWTGNRNVFDATNAAPAQDRLLFDLFTTAFNDNATRGTLSVNVGPTNANLAAWSALFSGIVVPPTSLTNSYTIISPVGTLGAGSPLWQLVNGTNGINSTRANTNLFPRQVFTHVGDILAVTALTEQSPFLNLANTNYNNDEMYEWLPQQTMSLMRVSGSPRYVIYSYGQTLKPAPNSIYTGGGQFFGMVTNYQVVSEIATRAVVRFGSTVTNVVTYATDYSTYTNWFSMPMVTNNNAIIESFNILPPD